MPVLFEDFQVVPRLIQLRLPKEILVDILDRAAGERANVNANDPSGTAGNEMRRWCTRFLREDWRLKELGWVPCAHSQVEGLRNDELEMKIAFMNTDARTGMPSKMPRSVSEKGSVSEKFIDNNYNRPQGELFGLPELPDPISGYDFWYLCGHVSDNHIAAELSRPVGMTKSIVDDYSERIIIWQPGDNDGISRPTPVPEDFAEIDLPALQRR